ncbi:Ig-like domain-containing protein, partial [Yokenella regensburgei]|uniref:Ig-like domain-containing protein n=1 Tax=Yokenella regensburgei TaxID=158877 RepID=UPI00192A4C87
MFPACRYRNILAWLLIMTQLLTPVLTMLPVAARASTTPDVQGTVQGLDALIRGQAAERSGYQEAGATPPGSGMPPLAPPSAPAEGGVVRPAGRDGQPTGSGLPDLSWPGKGIPGEGGTLPKMQEDKPADTPSGALASGAMQAGSLLSGDDRTDAAINYAKGIGEGLINQKVNDWLNQFGNAKISLGTDGQFSGDMLIPLHDTDRNLLFTQLGARRGQERNLVNVGAGYRAYTDDWMLGGNVFYDYDYTGKNRRLGVGGELWRDYLKLSANGYFRLTNWHQSVLSEMEDYDERPANGFDIRAEGYLPAWPHLGGSLKYEQYFGKGVSVADSTSPDTLKDSPVVLTAGLSYTPFPLMTLSASRAVGDSNDTRLALDLSYRLGVPWSEQVSPGSVDLMRSLAGNKYDFVDRNYNIVMQYRKQELLRIQLPERRTAQAAETLIIPLTVSRAKYGLKGVNWTVSPELTARGGRYRIVSPTEIQVTLPAYIFTGDQKATQTYRVSAVATDGHGNRSDTATMLIDVVPSENTVSHLTVSPGDRSVPANDTESYTITGTVTDGKGAPLVNQKVTFAVEGLINTAGQAGTTLAPVGGGKGDGRQLTAATGTDGKATIILRSKVAGEGNITATMDNGNSSAAKVTFVADSATASVRKVMLMDDKTAKPADGKNAFTYTALVKDKYDNTLANAPVSWAVDAAGVTLSAPTTQTDSNGKATVKLLSGTRVVTDITVSAHSAAQAADIDADKKVSFTAGNIAPDKSTLVASPDSITANGQAASTLTLTLVDVNNNPVTGAAGSLHASVAGLDNVSVSNFAEQGATGVYVATLTGTRAGIATITALSGSKKASTQTPTVTFSADKTTVQIKDMTIAPDGAAADGKAANGVKVTVTDKQGNPVPEVTVTFSVNGGATLTTVNGVSDANGIATTTVTSTTTGRYTVTASVNGQATTKETTFVADVATAHVSKVTLVGSINSLPANGQSRFSYTVTVVDNQGNPVSGVKVTPKADKAGVTATAAGVTDAGGQTTVTLTSSTTAVMDITVSAQAGDTAAVNADKTVSFIADAASAKVDSLAVTTDNAKADGQDADVMLVRVTDAGNNPVSGRAVVLKADGGAAIVDAVTTDAQGQATATLGGSSKTATAHFIADASTAKVDTVTQVGNDVSKVADGKNTFTYTVTVKDSNGNPVSGATVTPKADKAGVTATAAGVTDAGGQTIVTLTSSTAAVADITVSARAGSTASVNADKTVSFIADAASAQVDTVTLVGTDISKVADGKSAFTYTVMVKDGNGNRVSGVKVTPKADKAGVTATAAGVTDAGGQTTVTLTSST